MFQTRLPDRQSLSTNTLLNMWKCLSNPQRHCSILKAAVSQPGFCMALVFHRTLLMVPKEIMA